MTCRKCNQPTPTVEQEAHVEGCNCDGCRAACWADFGSWESCEAAQDAMLALARAIPPRALAELARVLTYGGEKHGAKACEPSSDQAVSDHREHAEAHLLSCQVDEETVDRDTGALHLIHAAARALLAAELVLTGEDRGK